MIDLLVSFVIGANFLTLIGPEIFTKCEFVAAILGSNMKTAYLIGNSFSNIMQVALTETYVCHLQQWAS